MDIVRTLIILLSLSCVRASSSSIGSEFESSLSCSKFHFEEKVLEKLVRLEIKMDAWEKSITSKLDEMNNMKKQIETFVQSVQDAQIQDQMRLNKSYQETVEHFRIQATNETDIYGSQMNAVLESLSSKIELFTKAEKKRESVKESMQFTLDREQKRLNSSFDQIVKNFKSTSSKTLQEIIVNQQKGYDEMVEKRDPVVFSAYRKGSQRVITAQIVKFDHVWTNIGNGYDPNTGIFTAPRTAQYHITAVILSQSGGTFYPRLNHNQVAVSGSYIMGDGYKTGTFDVVLSLQKGDEVHIAGYAGTFSIYSDSFAHVTFSGHSIA